MLTGKLGGAVGFCEALVAGVARDADAQLLSLDALPRGENGAMARAAAKRLPETEAPLLAAADAPPPPADAPASPPPLPTKIDQPESSVSTATTAG